MWGQLEPSSQDTAAAASQDELPIGPAGLTVCAALIAAAKNDLNGPRVVDDCVQ
jgi:hypothetical protein